jgi:Iron dependent repressor, N-terminal DNA binding domain
MPTFPESAAKIAAPSRDPLRLARYYKSLLESGDFKTRAEVARFLGVSRARVTQVLKRLDSPSSVLPLPDSA